MKKHQPPKSKPDVKIALPLQAAEKVSLFDLQHGAVDS
jgi:hypothetical protein